jgi:Leucine-rich repeat (LRR) protein
MPRHHIPSLLLERALTGVISDDTPNVEMVPHGKMQPTTIPSSEQTDMLDIEACIDQPDLAPLGRHVVKGRKHGKRHHHDRPNRQSLHRFLLSQEEDSSVGNVIIQDLTLDDTSLTHKKLGTSRDTGSTIMLRRRRLNTSELEYKLASITKTGALSAISLTTDIGSTTETPLDQSNNGCSNVKELDVSRNHITNLPANITLFATQLRILNLSNNLLTSFPHEILAFRNLEVLMLSQNKISGPMPEELPLSIPNLKTLRISANLITELPVTISNWRKMKSLVLGSVFGGNLIESIPEGCISAMPLEELDLSHNQLKNLPEDFAEGANLLVNLNLSDNQLETLPRSIGLFRNLKSLNLSKNHLTSLPIDLVNLVNLDILDVSENLLCILPGDILEFMRKTTLMITGNPLSRPGTCDLKALETAPDNSYMKIIRKMSQRAVATRSNVVEYEQCGPNGMGCESSPNSLMSSPLLSPYLMDDDAAIDHELSFHARQLNIGGSRPSTPINGSTASDYFVNDMAGLSRSASLPVPQLMSSSSSTSSVYSALTDSDGEQGTNSTPLGVDMMTSTAASPDELKLPVPQLNCETVPRLVNSLRELASRSVFMHKIPFRLENIPEPILSYVQPGAARPCAHCGKPYVKEWLSSVQVKSFRGHPAVVRRVRFCSERCWNHCVKEDQDIDNDLEEATSQITDTVVCVNGLPRPSVCALPTDSDTIA